MKNIFIVCTDLGLGGVQRKIIDLVNFAKAYPEYRFHLIVKLKTAFSFKNEITNPNVILYEQMEPLFLRRYKRAYYYFYIFYLLIRYQPISILAFFHTNLFFILSVKLLSPFFHPKIIVSSDNILSLYNQKEHIDFPSSPEKIRFLFRQCDSIITQTAFAKRDLIKNFQIEGKKITVIPNWFSPIRKTPLTQKRTYDLIYCGRFAKQKRLDLLLEVVKKIKKHRSRISLCLIGEGEDEKQIKKNIELNNLKQNVTLKKPTKNILRELTKAKLLVLTSSFEGHPMVVLEAMAMGTIPIVLNYPGAKEYIRARTGYIEKNIDLMSKRITSLLNHDRILKDMSQEARSLIQERYNQDLIQKTFITLLK